MINLNIAHGNHKEIVYHKAGKKKRPTKKRHRFSPVTFFNAKVFLLVGELGADELAVEASDVGDGFALGTNGLAGTCVGAVAEA